MSSIVPFAAMALLSALGCKPSPSAYEQPKDSSGMHPDTLAPYTTGYGPYGDIAYSDTGYFVPSGGWTTALDTATTRGGSGGGSCPEPASYGACEPPGAAIADSFPVWTFGWGSDLGLNPQWWFELVEDQATWDLRVADAEPLGPAGGSGGGGGPSDPPAVVDFGTHRVVIVGYRQDTSCGMGAEGIGVTAGLTGPTVRATVSDASFGCCNVWFCSSRGVAQAVAVPRSAGVPSGCVDVTSGPGACL